MKGKCVALLGFGALLVACSKPYSTPELDNKLGFRGLLDILEQTGSDRPRVAFSHGMCTHLHRAAGNKNWVRNQSELLAKSIGGTFTRRDSYEASKSYPRDSLDPIVKRYDVLIKSPSVDIDAVFFVWGESIDRHRENIMYENFRSVDDPNEPVRAWGNHLLKSHLMNSCFIDAVVYLGQNGDSIRSAMREATCELIGGEIATKPPTSGDPRDTVTCEATAAVTSEPPPSILVPESLGSVVLFDAFDSLLRGDNEKNFAQNRLSSVEAIFLVSNQIPLLNQGNVAQRTESEVEPDLVQLGSLGRFLDNITAARESVEDPPIQVVAFSDPNDLLSYRLLQNDFENRKYVLTNVLVSNEWTWLGLFEWPLTAHSGYEREEVINMMIEGIDPMEE